MSIRFRGGDRFQRGRGIGGLLRIAKNLFQPVVRTIGKAIKSNTGKAIGNALKEQAIESGTNLMKDVILGNDLKEGVHREFNTFKERAADGVQQLKESRKKRNIIDYSDGEEELKKNQTKTKSKPKQRKQVKYHYIHRK
jgi:hypothetical protein